MLVENKDFPHDLSNHNLKKSSGYRITKSRSRHLASSVLSLDSLIPNLVEKFDNLAVEVNLIKNTGAYCMKLTFFQRSFKT
jgi:hypothetical protein